MDPMPTIAAETAPAGGAAITEVIGMTVALTVAFGALVIVGEMHRRGRRTPLGTLGAFAERFSGLPAWAAIPLAVTAVALPGALFGYMWDAPLHIDQGRDEGPLANPSHYFILAGLYGMIAAGYLSTVLPKAGETPGRSAIRISEQRAIPLGGALIGAAGLFAFAGFPLDDIWHRLFGQDVTLWGPTHLIMLGGGFLTLIGVALLFEEGVANSPRRRGAGTTRDAAARKPDSRLLVRLADLLPRVPVWPSRVLIAGGFLAGLTIFQGEFDYGVPQFELVLQPLMIAVSAGIALVCARVWIGPWAAVGAVACYLVIRGVVYLLVGPVLGTTAPAMPLYLPEAILVELAALLLARRPLVLGAVAGVAVGTIGFAAEWPWINAVMAIEWTEALLPEGPILAAIGGLAGGMVGAVLGLALRRELPAPRLAGGVAIASLAAIMACFAFGLADRDPGGVRGQVTLTDVSPPPEREVIATVRFEPADVADGASWVRGIAWQGGGLVGFPLDRIGEGVYRTPEPLPVHGDWKAAVRLHNGHTLLGLGIYAPADEAIPVAAQPAPASFTRAMGPDRDLLQRERKDDVAPWTWTLASLSVLAMFAGFLSLLAWGLGRFARGPAELRPTPTGAPRRAGPHRAGVA